MKQPKGKSSQRTHPSPSTKRKQRKSSKDRRKEHTRDEVVDESATPSPPPWHHSCESIDVDDYLAKSARLVAMPQAQVRARARALTVNWRGGDSGGEVSNCG